MINPGIILYRFTIKFSDIDNLSNGKYICSMENTFVPNKWTGSLQSGSVSENMYEGDEYFSYWDEINLIRYKCQERLKKITCITGWISLNDLKYRINKAKKIF